jgi:MoxR-like ATPase
MDTTSQQGDRHTVPNIKGLDTAPTLKATLPLSVPTAYGPHVTVTHQGHLIVLTNAHGATLVTVDFSREKPRVKADLRAIDGDTVTPVNALLAPFGKVKLYWRTKEYRWHPINGAASVPVGARVAPSAPVVTPVVAPTVTPSTPTMLAPAAVVSPRPSVSITVKPGAGSGVVVIATERTYEGKKQPSVKRLTKTYSQVGDVLLPSSDVQTLEIAWALRAAGRPAGVRITGPAGTAKTRLAEQFAYTKGVPFLIVEGQSIQTAADWYGGFVPTAGGFEWVWSDFALALRRGEPMVILIDELNRPENERALNGLMGLMAWTAQTKPVGAPEALTLAPGILIMATVNEGVEYVGTVEIDAAVNDRFPWGVRMDYSPEAIEARVLIQHAPGLDKELAKRLVRVAASQRAKRDDDTLFPSHNVLSTRTLIEIANAVVLTGVEPTVAIWASVRSRFIREDEAALSVLIEAQFGANPEASEELPEDEELEQMLAAE